MPDTTAAFYNDLAGDNALPHLLSEDDLRAALGSIVKRLRPGGVLLATIRDYDALLETRPGFQGPSFFSTGGRKRIVHQVWRWDGDAYEVHLYLTLETKSGWVVRHFVSRCRPLRRARLSALMLEAGFGEVTWHMPENTGFYQPIVTGRG